MVDNGGSWNAARGSAEGGPNSGIYVALRGATVRTLVRSLFWMNSHVLFGLDLYLLCVCQSNKDRLMSSTVA